MRFDGTNCISLQTQTGKSSDASVSKEMHFVPSNRIDQQDFVPGLAFCHARDRNQSPELDSGPIDREIKIFLEELGVPDQTFPIRTGHSERYLVVHRPETLDLHEKLLAVPSHKA